MIKKIISVLLLLILTLSFVACGKAPDVDNGDKPKEDIVISKYEDSYGINDERTNLKWSFQLPETVTRLKMPDIFGDNMMFQQGKPIRIWGLAPSGKKIEVRLYNEKTGENVAAKGVRPVSDNSFICELPAMQASFTTYKLKITMETTERLYSNILIGEVFLASGQSNMQVTVGETYDGVELLKVANNDKIRAYNPAIMPMADDNAYPYLPRFENDNGAASWAKGDDNTLYGMMGVSAIAYSCALQMYDELNVNGAEVPVGFMNLPVGGSPVRSWLPRYAADEDDTMKGYLGSDYRAYDANGVLKSGDFSTYFNTKIAPIMNHNICGMIWYQGESDEGAIDMYKVAMEKIIECYGKEFRFEDGKMPMVMCHIAPFNMGYYENITTKTVQFNAVFDEIEQKSPETRATVALYDVDLNYMMGDCASIHPRVKEPIGRRCGKALYGLACTENGVSGYDSSSFVSASADDGALLVKFRDCGTGLVADGEVKGFSVAGANKVYYAAKAEIVGTDTVKVYSEYVSEPEYCAYAYSNLPMKANLKNKEGFAVKPFYGATGKLYCQHDWLDCDSLTVWRYLPGVPQLDGTTLYEGKNVDLYKTENATITLDSSNAISGFCLKYDASAANSALLVVLNYPYDVHQFNNFTSISIYVNGSLTLSGIDVVGDETASLTLIGTSAKDGYTRYDFSLSNVLVDGLLNNDYEYALWLKELKLNFTGTGTAYIDNMSLGNL